MTQVSYFPLQGGEDLVSPPLTIAPGRALIAQNYECDAAGRYRRVAGFERFDGQEAPSDAVDAEAAREDIAAVPGSGDILGVWVYNDVTYAFRNNAGGTAAAMYKSSASGWTLCDLGEYLDFDTGTAAFVEGEEVSQGAVTAEVTRVVLESGAWANNDAAGYLVIKDRAGGDFAAGAIAGDAAGAAAATAAQTANALAADGRFECINYNFLATTVGYRMYGCDGVSLPFEWDGSVFVPLFTGVSAGLYPSHVAAHKHHLFLSYSGGSLMHSGIGDPYAWTAGDGASEIGIGSDITGIAGQASVLAIWCDDRITTLYGTASDDWNLKTLTTAIGGTEYTLQQLGGQGFFLAEHGIYTLAAVQEYGDFAARALSNEIQPLIDGRSSPVAAVAVRVKDQYRIFYEGGVGISYTQGRGFTRLDYDVEITCACSVEESGSETILIGADDGFVYELEKGADFDGEDIQGLMLFPFNHLKSPMHKKRFRKITLECDNIYEGHLNFVVDFSYGSTYYAAPSLTFENPDTSWSFAEGGSGYWDIATWNSFNWDDQLVGEAYAQIDGIGQNISVTIISKGGQQHTLQGIIINYDVRGIQR